MSAEVTRPVASALAPELQLGFNRNVIPNTPLVHVIMPAPRLSQTADAARSAVEQAQFNEKTWVWVPDVHEGYLAGWVNKEDHEEEIAEVVMHQSGEVSIAGLEGCAVLTSYSFAKYPLKSCSR